MRGMTFAALSLTLCLPVVGIAQTARTEAEQSNQQAVAVADRFLEAWIIEQDVEKAAGFADRGELEKNIKSTFKADADADEWIRKVLAMWYIPDHGLVSSLGHGDPGAAGYAQLPLRAEDVPDRVRWKTLDDAFSHLEMVRAANRIDMRFVSGAFRHATKDVVMVVLQNINGDWKVVDLFWIVG